MASETRGPPAEPAALLDEKLRLMKEVFAATQRELLLVNLDGLTPLLEHKDALIGDIRQVDEALAQAGHTPGQQAEAARQQEIVEVVEAILENERALEDRIQEEYTRLRKELRDFDRQTRLRQYLEGQRQPVRRVDLKK